MSTIGSAGVNLAASIVASSRPEAANDRLKAASADQKFLVERQAMLSKTLADVADTEFGSERDADGRLPYARSKRLPGTAIEDSLPLPPSAGAQPAVDAFGDSGNALDVEA